MDFDSSGVRLHYEVSGADSGRPVIAVHGFASDYRLNWVGSRWQETLTQAGFKVIGLDCRGHGQSDKPHDPSAYSVDTMANDVVRLLDHLDVPAAAYLGYSMGGRIGLQVVLDHPRRVTRAVLGGIGSAGSITHADEIAHALELGRPTDDPIAQTFYRFASGRPVNDLKALAACMRGLRPHATPEQLALVRVPILVVVGGQDDLAAEAPELIEQVPSARLVTIPGRDHLSTVTSADFKRAALEFLTAE